MLFLHISDIHFKQAESGQPDDPNRALRNDLIRDIRTMRATIGKPADLILVSGDIAAAGKSAEYDFAYNWFENELCPAAECSIQNLFVVPGNHDVDRTAEAGPAQIHARASLRAVDVHRIDDELSKWLRDRPSANVIFGPIDNYNRFAAKFLCALGPYVPAEEADSESRPSRPFATRDLTLDDGSTLRLWGFNTVLVSDASDAVGRMLIDPAAAQIEAHDDVVHLVMCHHPFGWLKNRQTFEDRMNTVVKIQLFGHEHTRRLDENRRYLRIRAGALQPSRDDREWKPGYNWIDVSAKREAGKRRLFVKVWVRLHEVSQFIAMPDPDGNDTWDNYFELPDWAGPDQKPDDTKEKGDVLAQPVEAPMTRGPAPANVRSVTIKFFKLKEHEQRRLIFGMKLDRAGDRDLKDYELVINAIRRSVDEGRLDELDARLDQMLADARSA